MRARDGLLTAILLVVGLWGCWGTCGCGPVAGSQEDAGPADGPPAPITGLQTITVEPADLTLDIVGIIPARQAYKATGSFADGHSEDITARVRFELDDPTLGGFVGAQFTSKLQPGQTSVIARNGTLEGSTGLTLWYAQVRYAEGAPGDAAETFAGATAGGADPELLYPADGTLIPPNLTILDVQFRPGAANDLFEVRFKGDTSELRLYSACSSASGCSVVPDEVIWQEISSTNAGHLPMQVSVRGLSSADPEKFGLSETRGVGVAQEQMNGGIYYWQATGDGVIRRYDFGLPTPQGETYYSGAQAGGMCVGCHTMSMKGNRIGVGLDAPTQVSTLQVLDVASKSKLFQLGTSPVGGGSNFQAFSPDETEIITSNGGTMVLRDAVTGAPKDPNPLVALGTMPDYSPDGALLVFAKPVASPCMLPTMCMPGIAKGSIALLPWDATTSTWGVEQILVQQSGSENNYYPAFSPDGKWILYNFSTGSNSYDAGDARVRVVNVETGAVTDLGLANANGGNSWPKWSPFVQTHRGGTIMWLTFSSRRPYGYQSVSCGSGGNCAQVWMVAFDVEKALAGVEDPSYAAFRLPFQDIATGNHIAQWVPTIVRTPCSDEGECGPGEICSGGQCVPDIQ
jgi:hypothetical protein